MDEITVLSTTNLKDELLQRVAAVSPRLAVRQVFCATGQELEAHLPGVEVLLTQHGAFDASWADRLRWIQLQTAGAERILDNPVLRAGVTVTTASGIHATPMAEYVLGVMLAMARQLPAVCAMQRERTRPAHPWRALRGRELRGETIGILGYGSIGREVGRLALSLGMRVIALSASGRRRDEGYYVEGTGDPEGRIPIAWYTPDDLHTFLASCGFVVVAAPLVPQTRGLIDEAALRAMRSDAVLVNIARGEIVQEEALLRALREGWIAGAALDVFAQEPLPPEHPFYDLDNVLITPHMAAMTRHYNERLVDLFVANLRRYLAGQELLNRVDVDRGY